MNNTPLVSVIIVTYKTNLNYISQAIDSVKNQSYKNIEIIIVCDEPRQDIEKYFVELKKTDKTIIYKKNEKKSNVAIARNQGIFLSNGKYIAMLDDDDLWDDKNKIETQVNFLEENINYGFCGVNKVNMDISGKFVNTVKMRSCYEDINKSILQSNQFAQSGVMIRKDVLFISGIYDTTYFTEDYELWCRMGMFCKFCNIDSSILYRIQNNSLSHKNILKVKKTSFKVFWKYKKFYPNFLRALILRIGDFILPTQWSTKILNIFKKQILN